jgi:hypothetical protein
MEVKNLAKPETICKVLDQLDQQINDLAEENDLDAEDVKTVLDSLKARFQNNP